MSSALRITLTAYLAVTLAPAQAAADASVRIAVAIADQAEDARDVRDGMELGVAEIERAADLLRRPLTFVRQPAALSTHPVDASVVIAALPAGVPTDSASPGRPVVLVTAVDEPAWSGPSVFVVSYGPGGRTSPDAADGCGPGIVTAWDAAFARYGAGELNERFERSYRRPMTPAAWGGWVAAKAAGEAVLRSDEAAPASVERTLRSLRFDGHKGRALYFGPDGRLVHPRYILRTCPDGPHLEDARGEDQPP